MCAFPSSFPPLPSQPNFRSFRQVNTYWNWADVHIADNYADSVAMWSAEGMTVEQYVRFLPFFPSQPDLIPS
jgi:hypothetical protein